MSDLGHEYRLAEVKNYQSTLLHDIKKCKARVSRYTRTYNILYYIDLTSTSLTGILGAGSIVSAVTLIGMPVGIVLGSVTAILAGASASSLVITKHVMKRIQKYQSILLLATSTLESIKLLISQAVDDGIINNHEFERITTCFQKYNKLKFNITRHKIEQAGMKEAMLVK